MTRGEFSVTILATPDELWPWISQLEMAALVPLVFAMMGKPDIRKRMAKLKTTIEAAT